ncbi:hypothetical protein EVAR_19735_1 [Eumeta japonica]|uniref:Uncharacterized protein n=1 Tax=Eumeta variegata TaxID=151549 RepID=A0A4C1USB3_EUMVA|nr:hypothetical protein EVAR_19735_1 [Eumeta japonica]
MGGGSHLLYGGSHARLPLKSHILETSQAFVNLKFRRWKYGINQNLSPQKRFAKTSDVRNNDEPSPIPEMRRSLLFCQSVFDPGRARAALRRPPGP